ncbi:MAG: phosphoglycerate kinase [Deltaproteobacteria bacterium]|jgi:phosphoglycerate kinase|nr:phosphoglycerate kinase [Deltaproteobacteria bacterium]
MSVQELKIKKMADLELKHKTVLTRLDINSPIDGETKRIKNDNRINMCLSTLRYLKEQAAKVVIMAHQGDSLDYHNLIPLNEHAEKLTMKLGWPVDYIDDPCGPAAQAAIKALKPGQALLLGNLRYLAEEISTFENAVKLTASQMASTYLVRSLAPLAEAYVNDAFSAAHRNAPSMVAFQEFLPSAAGNVFFEEVSALNRVMSNPARPCLFALGGAKISDAFGMLNQVLNNGSADAILTSGLTGNVFLMAAGVNLGSKNEEFIRDLGLGGFVSEARDHLNNHKEKIHLPVDLAYAEGGVRKEAMVENLGVNELFCDIGQKTIESYAKAIAGAGTIFVNGPAGKYESKTFDLGTKSLFEALANSLAYAVIGGGDTVTAAQNFIDSARLDMVCTAGGAMVQYLSGKKLPLMTAMEKAYRLKF